VTTEDDFQQQLDRHPNDLQTRLVFADWLQERGDLRAEGYRALSAQRLYSTVHQLGDSDYPLFDASRVSLGRDGPLKHWCLPHDWFLHLEGGAQRVSGVVQQVGSRQSGVWLDYDSRREAEDAAAAAFAKLPAERRAELLLPVVVTRKPRAPRSAPKKGPKKRTTPKPKSKRKK
jgi:uncharacterized protein (TIGR02996 family)